MAYNIPLPKRFPARQRSYFIKFNKKYWKNSTKTGIWNNGAFSYTLEHVKRSKISYREVSQKTLRWLKATGNINNSNYSTIKKTNILNVIKIFFKEPLYFDALKFFSIQKKPRNVFINISTLDGKILRTYSSGMLYKKGSERRTFVAFEDLLKRNNPFKITWRENFFRFTRYIFKFKATILHRAGFKRNIKIFLRRTARRYRLCYRNKLNSLNLTKNIHRWSKRPNNPYYKFIGLKSRAHNGVRRKKKKRK